MKLSPEAQAVLDRTFDALSKAHVGCRVHFEYRPRYCISAFTSAIVSQGVCAQMAVDEVEAHHQSVTGMYGDEKLVLAETKGLAWICFARWQRSKKVFRYDLITGQVIQEPKRLEHDDLERLKMLRKHVGVFGADKMIGSNRKELAELEFRASIHRQETLK